MEERSRLRREQSQAEYRFGLSLHYRVLRGEITGLEAIQLMKELRSNHPELQAMMDNNEAWLCGRK